MKKTVEVWCCGVAADHELGETNVEVYASEEDCYAARICSQMEPEICAPRKITATFETDWVPVYAADWITKEN